MISTLLDRIGEWNPQLFRELKGGLRRRNITLTAGISLVGQLLVYLFFQMRLPVRLDESNRYCTGPLEEYYPRHPSCLKDAVGNILVNWELWWLDVFTCLSIIAIFVLLVGGVYLLIADLSNEERRGTFGFIRLSPQASSSVLLGKILGVPSLLYLLVAFTLPLHLYAASAARVSVPLVFGFYSVLATACFFFYSAALLYGLVSAGLGSFQAWLGSAAVSGFLGVMTVIFFNSEISSTPGDWFMLLSPTTLLMYLVGSAPHSLEAIDYGNPEWFSSTWFDWPLFEYAATAIPFILGNFAIWT
ncbi:MAG: hypothetical protein SVX43_04260, partial [Cyanobacteriota bacterium]|nr:hypothetical protein [Cyanobacteriota bacterium]